MEQELKIVVNNLSELPGAAEKVLQFSGQTKIFLFDAPMGAGKTTFIKTICEALGSSDNFSSPTYSIINEYGFPGGKIFHFDLYRLKDEAELFDLGVEEYLDSGEYCFFEWPELVYSYLENDYVEIKISPLAEARIIEVAKKNIGYLIDVDLFTKMSWFGI